MTTLLLGSSGKLGSALARHFPTALMPSRLECSFECPRQVLQYLDAKRPSLIVNAAAATDVESAEANERQYFQINSDSPALIAEWCLRNECRFVTFSSDYVFEGSANRPLREDDEARPLNVYGRTKLHLESRLLALSGPILILRTSWLYGDEGREDFVVRVLSSLQTEERVFGVIDEISGPTWSEDLAYAAFEAIRRWTRLVSENSGPRLYHLAAMNPASRYDWAAEILRMAHDRGFPLRELSASAKVIEPISSKQWKSKVKRPAYSFLDCRSIREELGIRLSPWRDGLLRYFSHCKEGFFSERATSVK